MKSESVTVISDSVTVISESGPLKVAPHGGSESEWMDAGMGKETHGQKGVIYLRKVDGWMHKS